VINLKLLAKDAKDVKFWKAVNDMEELEYEERAENIMPKFSSWGDGLVKIKRKYWYESRNRIISILKRIKELEAELKSARAKYDLYKVCAEDKVKSQAKRIKELERTLYDIAYKMAGSSKSKEMAKQALKGGK